MYEGAIAQWLKQLRAGQPCLQQLQKRGKGGLSCSLAKATAEFSPPLNKHLPCLLSAPSPCLRQNLQPKGEGSTAGCKPSLFSSQILMLSSRHRSASAAASPQAGGLSQPMAQQELCRLEASWVLALTTRNRLLPKSSFTKH